MIPDTDRVVIAFTDGACSGNGKSLSRGGVGVHFIRDLVDISQPLDDTVYKATNQRAELQAVLVAILTWKGS